LNFNNETSNLKEYHLEFLKIKVKEHPFKILTVESQMLKLMNIHFCFLKKKLCLSYF